MIITEIRVIIISTWRHTVFINNNEVRVGEFFQLQTREKWLKTSSEKMI